MFIHGFPSSLDWVGKQISQPLYLIKLPYLSSLNTCFYFTMAGKFQRKIWVLAFFLATAAVLVPAPLIEFRYYTIPFFFLMLHSHTDDYRSFLFTGFLYITINVFTMMMFLYCPFHWSHEPGTQRFIWQLDSQEMLKASPTISRMNFCFLGVHCNEYFLQLCTS